MVAENMTVKLTIRQPAKLEAAFRRASRDVRRMVNKLDRVADTRGDRHIESIIRDSLTRRLPVDDTARRLMVASDIAQVLDRRRLDNRALDAAIRDGLSGWGA